MLAVAGRELGMRTRRILGRIRLTVMGIVTCSFELESKRGRGVVNKVVIKNNKVRTTEYYLKRKDVREVMYCWGKA